MNRKSSHSSRVRGTTLKTLAAAVAATLSLGTNAETPYFDEALVFGDSLLDGGAFPDPDTGVRLRFTNMVGAEYAPVAAQIWAESLGLEANSAATNLNPEGSGSNYAIGGITSDQVLSTIIGEGAGTYSFLFDEDITISGDAYLAGNTPSANSLAFIDGGGNDFLALFDPDLVIPGEFADLAEYGPAVAAAGATNLITAAATLDAAGVNYIFVSNLPNLGATPFVQMAELAPGGAGSIVQATALSSGLNQLLAIGAGNTTANIIPVDAAGMFNYVTGNAELFGYASGALTGALIEQQFMCYDDDIDGPATLGVDDIDCIEHPLHGIDGLSPDPDMLIFNDGVHPTATVHAIWADYLSDIVNAPRIVGTLPQLGLNVARQQLQVAGDQLSEQRGTASEASWFISGALGSADIDAAGMPEDQHNSLSIGGFVPLSEQLTLGGIISLGDQETDLSGGSIDSSSVGFSATLTYRSDALFVESIGSLALSNHDEVERSFNLGPQQLRASGETDGETLAFDLLAGFDLMADSETLLAPAIGVSMLNSSVDGYLESGGAVSNYQWADQEMDSKQLRLGVIGKMLVNDNVSLQAEIFANDESEDGFTQVTVKNTTAGFPSYHLPGIYVDGGSFFTADLGLSVSAGAGRVRVGYSYSDQGEGSNSLRVNYSAKF